MGVFVTTFSSFLSFLYLLFHDLLYFLPRPLYILHGLSPTPLPIISTIATGEGLMMGVLVSLTIALLSISINVMIRPSELFFKSIVFPPFAIDALIQLPSILIQSFFGHNNNNNNNNNNNSTNTANNNSTVPHSPSNYYSTDIFLHHYPISHTALLVFFFVIPSTITLYFPRGVHQWMERHTARFIALSSSIIILRLSYQLFFLTIDTEDTNLFAWFLLIVSYILFVFFITPQSIWEELGELTEELLRVMSVLFSNVYLFITRVWPKIVGLYWSLIEHPIIVSLHYHLIAPLWRLFSPLIIPLSTLFIAFSTTIAVIHRLKTLTIIEWNIGLLTIAQMQCIISALISALVLMIHALARIGFITDGSGVIQWRYSAIFIWYCCRIASFPYTVARKIFQGRIIRFIGSSVEELFNFAARYPPLSIPLVLIVNGSLFYLFYESPFFSSFWSSFLDLLASLFFFTTNSVIKLQSTKIHSVLIDSTLAVIVVAAAQSATYTLCESIIKGLVVVGDYTNINNNSQMSVDELNEVARAMSSPRQCARCCFGPIDHMGCNNLLTHDGERRMGSSGISNACPRCGWFVRDLNQWPAWDAELSLSGNGLLLFRQRIWGELVLAVRSSAKLLLIPFICLQFPLVGPFFAFSYIIPWMRENHQLFNTIYSPNTYLPPRNNNSRRRGGGEGAEGGDAECGHRAIPDNNISMTEDEAIRSLLYSQPSRIFLSSGTICPVCLDDFSEEAVIIVNNSSTTAVEELRRLSPSLIALRCGHVIDYQCAEQVVKTSRGAGGTIRHLRCPLCREPITLSGATSARFFT